MNGELCCFCGASAEESDHIEAKSKGGRDDWPNRSPVCRACNVAKGTKDLLGFMLARLGGTPEAEEIRNALIATRQRRIELEQADEETRRKMGVALLKVQETKGISMSEAAELLGVSRVTAYELLKRSSS